MRARWRGVLDARGYEPPPLEFVELVAEQERHSGVQCGYRVTWGGFAVDVRHDFDEDSLGRLLRVVASC